MRAIIVLGLGLAACGAAPEAPMIEPEPIVIRQADIETRADGRCFALDPGPLRDELVVERVLVVPEVTDANGTVTQPAIYKDVEKTVQVPVREPERFEVVCPQNFSQGFVASIQRALSVRGAYSGTINGLLDDGTRDAILAYQTGLGRRSANLAIETAQSFGLIQG